MENNDVYAQIQTMDWRGRFSQSLLVKAISGFFATSKQKRRPWLGRPNPSGKFIGHIWIRAVDFWGSRTSPCRCFGKRREITRNVDAYWRCSRMYISLHYWSRKLLARLVWNWRKGDIKIQIWSEVRTYTNIDVYCRGAYKTRARTSRSSFIWRKWGSLHDLRRGGQSSLCIAKIF